MSPPITPDELFEIDVKAVIDETPKALQVLTVDGTRHWLPRSQIVEVCADSLIIPLWLAEANGIARAIEVSAATIATVRRHPGRPALNHRRSMMEFRSYD